MPTSDEGMRTHDFEYPGQPPALTSAQQKEAARRRSKGATLAELARNYARGHIYYLSCDASRRVMDALKE